MPSKIQKVIPCDHLKNYWESYNHSSANSQVVLIVKDQKVSAKSYTHAFFKEFKLSKYLNSECNKILQLGASTGDFISEYQKEAGWEVQAYDYSKTAIKELRKKGVPAREVNLQSQDSSGRLAYTDYLAEDLVTPVNIFLIRILEYLDPTSLNLLLFDLILKSKPDSVFVIIGSIKKHGTVSIQPALQPNYVVSFFAPRTDIELMLQTETTNVSDHNDFVLVAKKITKRG